MIPVRQFNQFDTVEVMQAHAKACRERIQNAKARPAPVAKFPVFEPRKLPPPMLVAGPRDILHLATPITPGARIISEVCRKHDVTLTDIQSARRSHYLCLPRQEIAYRMRAETKLSFPQIGKMLNRDHTTALHGARKYAERLAKGEVAL